MKLGRKQWILAPILAAAVAATLVVDARTSTPDAVTLAAPTLLAGMTLGAPDLKSAGTLAFGPNNVLFIGDSQGAAVFAVDVRDEAKDAGAEPIRLQGIDAKIASLLGTTADAVVINDLAVHPVSQNVYLAVSRGTRQRRASRCCCAPRRRARCRRSRWKASRSRRSASPTLPSRDRRRRGAPTSAA